MKKKIMYALMFALICICAIVIGKIKFSGTEKQQPSSLVSETDNLKDSESNFVEEETERSTQKTAEEQEIILEKETTSESLQTETAESQQTDLVNQIDYALEKMTVEQKVAQLFIITPDALTGISGVSAAGDATYAALQQYPVGGLVYFENNLQSYEQISEMLHNVQQYSMEISGLPLFLAVDEEGGTVARISGQGYGIEPIEDMAAVGASGDYERAQEIGTYIGSYLSDLGFNVDFAPCADVLTNPANTVVARRSFGSDAALVAEMTDLQRKAMEQGGIIGALKKSHKVIAYASGLESGKVLSVCKHFPGHGATSEDSHQGFAYIQKTEEELVNNEWIPFKKGIEEGAKMIMVGHIVCSEITGTEDPSSLSYYMVTEILRQKMGFQGLVVTDALNMGAIAKYYTSAQAAVKAVQAGVDLLLMPSDFSGAYQGVLNAVYNGEISEERLNESLYRILQVKNEMRAHGKY